MSTLAPHRRRAARAAAAALLAATTLLAPAAARAADDGGQDPNLDQTLAPDQAIVHGVRVLDAGHVDMGPRFDGGQWRFLVHDDAHRADANATSVWRYPDETVLHVLDAAQLSVPDDPAYSFVGADPGAPVWVVPQTQNPDVVWLGWNTQDPEVMATIDRGVTLSLTGVQGPGTVTMYLQSGSFGEPQVLWDSRVSDPQPVWVDVNTHTHANWVFTQPGVYLLRLQADADLVDGSSVSDTQLIRFAVGTATSPDDALAATWAGGEPSAGASTPPAGAADDGGASGPSTGEQASTPLVPILVGAIALVAVALVAGFAAVAVRGNRAKRRALAARAGTDAGDQQ